MTAHTLRLADDWDLHVTPGGNLPVVTGDYATAQNVANAFRLFTQDAWFFPERGIPHFLLELRAHPRINVLRARLQKAALAVEHVTKCEINLMSAEGRDLSGYAALTLDSGAEANVSL